MADINRSDAEALLRRQEFTDVVQEAEAMSAALASFRTVNMGSKTARMPVLSVLPTAGFVTEAADATGLKPTTEAAWTGLELIAEEIAAIVPVHEDVFEDSELNIWDEVRPGLAGAFGAVLDSAVFFGINKPSTWPDAIVPGARAAGNVYSGATAGDLAEDINQVWGLVEADGFDVNAQYAPRTIRATLRGLRDSNGSPIFVSSLRDDGQANMVYGEDIYWVRNGSWQGAVAGTPNTGADFVAGDATKAILGVRSDVEYKILTEATLDTGGGTLLHLAQRDMIAIRAKMRIAFQVAVPTSREAGANRYPFAILDV